MSSSRAAEILASNPDLVSKEIFQAINWDNVKGPEGLRNAANRLGIPNVDRRNEGQLDQLIGNIRSGIGRLLAIREKGLETGQQVLVTRTGAHGNFEGVINMIMPDGRITIKGRAGAFNPISMHPIS